MPRPPSSTSASGAAASTAAAGASFPVWAIRCGHGAAAVGGVVGGTSTGRSAAASTFPWWLTGGEEYETPRGNFKIHYVTLEDEDAVPDDPAFRRARIPFEGKGTPKGHPLYVRYLGELLEDCLKGFNKMGLEVPRAEHIRYDVFVENLGERVRKFAPRWPHVVFSNRLSFSLRKPWWSRPTR